LLGKDHVEAGYRLLAMGVDALHLAAMLLWGIGLPLLFWHGRPRLSRLYMWYAIVFVVVTLLSHHVIGECVLTSLARSLWIAGGIERDTTPFTTVVVNAVASIRPSSRIVVLLWELGVLLSAAGSLWCWSRTKPRRGGTQQDIALH